jgi:predicted O-linked N-acetylglucosamine transferase (SPINDLY family)
LPDSFWCYDPRSTEPEVAPLPALSEGYVRFGCLNASWKINAEVAALWARVLLAVEGSKLALLAPGLRPDVRGRAPTAESQRNVLEVFRREGSIRSASNSFRVAGARNT